MLEDDFMKTIKLNRKLPLFIVISAILGSVCCSCSSKTYVSTYTNREFNPQTVTKMALVLEDVRVTDKYNIIFAHTFIRAVLEKDKFKLASDTYILKETLPEAASEIA